MILSVNFLPVPTEESVKYYTKKLDSLEANSMRFQQKQLQRMQIAPPEPYSFRKDRDSITDSLNDIIQKDLGMVVATVTPCSDTCTLTPGTSHISLSAVSCSHL